MTRDDLNPVQQTLVDAVQAEFDRVLADIGPQLDQRPEPQFAQPDYRNIQAAQNALRTCIEALLVKMIPYGETVPIELAIRLASYALSALPIEAQEPAVVAFAEIFPTAHSRRISQGIRLSTTWQTDGRERANFPNRDS